MKEDVARMMILMHPTYTLKIEIQDRPPQQNAIYPNQMATLQGGSPVDPHKFYRSGKTGCDDVLAAVKDALAKAGLSDGVTVSFERFEHKG